MDAVPFVPQRTERIYVPGIKTLAFLLETVYHTVSEKASGKRLLPIRKHREERENGIASAVPFSHFSIDAVTFDISKAPMPL